MRKWVIAGVTVLVAGLSILLTAALRYRRPLGLYACSGKVVDTSGRPVANARAGISTCVGETAVSYSNHRGVWRIYGLPKDSEYLGHVSGCFVTHPNYVGVFWPTTGKVRRVVLERPISLKVRFKEPSSMGHSPRVYAELDDDYKAELAAHYGVEGILPHPYPSPSQNKLEDGFELSPLMSGRYKVTAHIYGKPTVVKYFDTREQTELWF
jgi:hypothetical protein